MAHAAGAPEPLVKPNPVVRPHRILVRLPNWVGDVVMATPLLRVLREHWPAAEIVAEGKPFLEDLLTGLPTIDGFLPDTGRGWRAARERARRLAAKNFDLAVLLPDSPRSALGPFLARIPNRIGYSRDPLRRLFLTHPLKPPMRDGKRIPIPMPERYLALARALGCKPSDAESHVSNLAEDTDRATPPVELVVSPTATARVRSMLERQGVDPDARFIVGAPGANFGSSKLYPINSFAAACDGMSEQFGLAVVLAPAPAEVDLALDVAAHMKRPAVVLDDPPTSLEELKSLIALSSLIFSNDTGPRHMAVALGTPTVVTMGPTDRRHTDYQLEHQRILREDVECAPCHEKECPIDHRCMTRLSPSRVISAAEELLAAPNNIPLHQTECDATGFQHSPNTPPQEKTP
jgi:heptosyltransferase-2